MKTFCHRRFSPFNLYLFSTISLLCLVSWSSIQVTAQDEDPPEIINKIPKHIPLKIELENKEKKEVVKELRIKVTNTSDRPIYKLHLLLTVLDVLASDGNKYSFSLNYGTYRSGEPLDVPAQPNDMRLESGESYVFQIGKKQAEMFKKGMEKYHDHYPKKFEVKFQFLIFGDGTGYLDTSGSPFPDKPKPQSNLISPSLSEKPSFLEAFGYRKAREVLPVKIIGLTKHSHLTLQYFLHPILNPTFYLYFPMKII